MTKIQLDDPPRYRQVMDDTIPGKLGAISLKKLQDHYHYLSGLMPYPILMGADISEVVGRRIEELRTEIDRKRQNWWAVIGLSVSVLTAVGIAIYNHNKPSPDIDPSKARMSQTPRELVSPIPLIVSPSPATSIRPELSPAP